MRLINSKKLEDLFESLDDPDLILNFADANLLDTDDHKFSIFKNGFDLGVKAAQENANVYCASVGDSVAYVVAMNENEACAKALAWKWDEENE